VAGAGAGAGGGGFCCARKLSRKLLHPTPSKAKSSVGKDFMAGIILRYVDNAIRVNPRGCVPTATRNIFEYSPVPALAMNVWEQGTAARAIEQFSPAHKTQPSEKTDKKAEKTDNVLHFSATGKVPRKTTHN